MGFTVNPIEIATTWAFPLSIANTANAFDVSGSTTATFSSQSIGAANDTRRIIVGASSRQAMSSVTIGGTTADVIYSQSATTGATTYYAGFYALLVPSGTSLDVVLNHSVSPTSCAISIWAVTGSPYFLTQATANGSIVTDGSTLQSTTFDIRANGVAMWVGVMGDVAYNSSFSSATRDYNQSAASARTHYSAHKSTSSLLTGHTETVGPAQAPGYSNILLGLSLKPVA